VATSEPLTAFDDGTLQVDFVQQEVTINGQPVNLKPLEYRLLTALVLHRGEVFSSDGLMELFGADAIPRDVAYTLMCLRTKLSQKEHGELIETVRGFGVVYRSPNR